MNDDNTYNFLKWTAIAGAVLLVVWMAFDHFSSLGPGDVDVVDGNNAFKDGQYEQAIRLYKRALKTKPDHLGALHALANSYVQLKNYPVALQTINEAIKLNPTFGGYYAIRGIIHDHSGQYKKAIADYEIAEKLYPEVSDGMHWLDRLLHNIHEKPPTVSQRLNYLKQQMALPPGQRVLSKPELDTKQRPYEQ